MILGDSPIRCRSLSLAALGLAAFAIGCQIRVGDAAGPSTVAADDCTKHGSPDCHASDALYGSARADWAKKQQQFDATFADEITAFHALEADLERDDATPATATRAEELRTRFLKRCIDESGWSTAACWHGTFARDITLALAKIRFRQGDLLDAAVEAFTIQDERDLRPDDEKIWRARGLSCEDGEFAARFCSTFVSNFGAAVKPRKPVLSPELAHLTSSTTEHDGVVDWRGGNDIQSVTKTGASAVVSIKPWKGTSDDAKWCGDPEWRADGSGNKVLVTPCHTAHVTTQGVSYPPALVPLSELGDFKLSNDADLLVGYARKGKK